MNFDYTGYGYASGGNASTLGERLQTLRNQYHTNRAGDAMQYIDPYMVNATEQAMRLLVRDGKTAAEARRLAFGTKAGQMASAAIGALRRADPVTGESWMGQGDPLNYSANIMQGLSQGMNLNRMGADGRMEAFSQRVTGSSALTEQMAINFQKSLLTNLYGTGMPDPRKLNGYNMEDASQVFRMLNKNGSFGPMGTVIRDPNFKTRLLTMQDNEVNPLIRKGLEGVTESNLSSRLDQARKDGNNGLVDTLSDLKNTKAKYSLASNPQAMKDAAETIRETTKGMAAIADIYKELSSPEQLQALQRLSGVRITSSQTARNAKAAIDRIRTSAIANGLDPRTEMDDLQKNPRYISDRLLNSQRSFGMDDRHMEGAALASMVSVKEAKMAGDAMATQSNQVSKQLRGMGMESREHSGAEYMADINKVMDAVDAQYPAFRYGVGLSRGQYKDDEKFKARVSAGMKEVANARTPGEIARAHQHMQETVQQQTGMRLREFARTGAGMEAINDVDEAGAKALQSALYNGAGVMAINPNEFSALRLHRESGASYRDAALTREAALKGMGAGGMLEMLDPTANGGKGGSRRAEDIAAALQSQVERGVLSPEQSDAFRKTMLDKNGQLRDVHGYQALIQEVYRSHASGASIYDQQARAARELSVVDADNPRTKMSAGGLSLKGIANALISGQVSALADPDSTVTAIQALQAKGYGKDFGDVSRFDMTKGLEGKDAEQLDRMTKGDLSALAKESGFKSLGALAAGSFSDPRVLQAIRERLHKSSEIGMTGSLDDTVVATKEGMDKFRDSNMDAKMRAVGGLYSTGMPEKERDEMIDGILRGKVQAPATDAYDPKAVRTSDQDGSRTNARYKGNSLNLPNYARHLNMASMLTGDNDDARGALIEANKASGNQIYESMRTELLTLKEAVGKGSVLRASSVLDGKNVDNLPLNKNTIESIEAAVKVLADSASKIHEATQKEKDVQTIHIGNVQQLNIEQSQ